MHPIYILWATPRSTSTAFEWMMRMRGDMTCFHEPFGEAWHQGDDARWPRLTPESPRQPGLTIVGVLQRLLKAAEERPVFSKDMPQYTDHLWDEAFLGRFCHSFLIRHPAKVLSSCARNWDHFVPKEIGFDDQRRLFDRLAERDGRAPPVIDSDDLLTDPQGIVAAWCDALGIRFIPEALSWEPGARDEVLWYDKEQIWHDTLKKSDGLKPQKTRPADISKTPDWVQAMYRDFLPHYEHLHKYRIRVPSTASS
ncbi:MAG: hypothetical protein RIC87_09405 [Kiloniellales bacterium]